MFIGANQPKHRQALARQLHAENKLGGSSARQVCDEKEITGNPLTSCRAYERDVL